MKTVRYAMVAGIVTVVATGGALYLGRGTKPSQAAPDMPPVPVTVQTLQLEKLRVWTEFSGRLRAVDSVELRPQVSGRITAVRFEDGQHVKAGDILFVIDPRPYEAAVARARANLASAQTNAAFAKVEFERAASMIKSQVIPQRVYDERANAQRVANATLESAVAQLKQAELDLEYAHVRAPISGRASRAEITVGNLVQAGPGAPLLTTIVGNHSIYVDFEVDERTYVEIAGGAQRREDERRIPVQLSLPGENGRTYEGHVHSFDNHIDVATGTIRTRAKFDNSDGSLVPGMFANVRLASAAERDLLLIPERAIGFDQSKKFVFVVGDDNKVAYREVELGKQVQAQRIALKGVQVGDRVIVDGVQKVRPNAIVSPQEATNGLPKTAAAQ